MRHRGLTAGIPVLRRQRQESHFKFEVSLVYIVSSRPARLQREKQREADWHCWREKHWPLLSSRGPKFKSHHPHGSSQPLELQFQGN